MEEQNRNLEVIASQDITDEMRIQFQIDKFYEFIEGFNQEQSQIRKIKLMRNNLVNMMDTYLKKFQNNLIMDSFYKKLKETKKNATSNGFVNKYNQYMNEIRVIQEFKGVKENIADKLAEQLIDLFRNSEVIERAKSTNDN